MQSEHAMGRALFGPCLFSPICPLPRKLNLAAGGTLLLFSGTKSVLIKCAFRLGHFGAPHQTHRTRRVVSCLLCTRPHLGRVENRDEKTPEFVRTARSGGGGEGYRSSSGMFHGPCCRPAASVSAGGTRASLTCYVFWLSSFKGVCRMSAVRYIAVVRMGMIDSEIHGLGYSTRQTVSQNTMSQRRHRRTGGATNLETRLTFRRVHISLASFFISLGPFPRLQNPH
jgi:hypothetical protein